MNQLILGDNLEIMRKMESESIDLIGAVSITASYFFLTDISSKNFVFQFLGLYS